MATMLNARESTENISSSRRVRDVAKQIAYLDPSAAPFTLLASKSGSRTVSNSKFEWIEKERAPKIDSVEGTITTGDLALVVANGGYWQVGDIGVELASKERFLVTAISTDTLTITRSVGDTAAATMTDEDDLQIIGSAHAEGAALPTAKTHQETYPFNYTQIFRNAFGVTGTQDASENYTGKDRPRLRMEKAIEHKVDIERAFLFGERDLYTTGAGSTNAPRRATGGFEYWATSNVLSSVGTVTEPELEGWLEDVFKHTAGSEQRVLFASPLLVSVIDQLAAGRLQMVPSDTTYGIAVNRWVTSHGSLLVVKHRLLENGTNASPTQGWEGYGFAVEPKKVREATLRGRDTKLREDVGTPGDDGYTDEYLSEKGLQVENPEVHGSLTGVTG